MRKAVGKAVVLEVGCGPNVRTMRYAVRKRRILAHFFMQKQIILPRQARDKRAERESQTRTLVGQASKAQMTLCEGAGAAVTFIRVNPGKKAVLNVFKCKSDHFTKTGSGRT